MNSRIRLVLLFTVSLALLSAAAHAQPSLSEQSKLLGRPLTIRQTSAVESVAHSTSQKITQDVKGSVMGRTVNLMKVELVASPSTAATSTAGATTGTTAAVTPTPVPGLVLNQHDLYIGGVRVWNGTLNYGLSGVVYSGGVAPTQLAIPLVAYPLGPVLLKVDAGVEFEGQVDAQIVPGLTYPLQGSMVSADLSANLYAAAYLEASANLLMLRGGLGGRVELIDTKAGFQSLFLLDGTKPTVTSYGYAKLLSGHVYGYLDYKLMFGKWSRLLNQDFFNFGGKCLSFGDASIPCGT